MICETNYQLSKVEYRFGFSKKSICLEIMHNL